MQRYRVFLLCMVLSGLTMRVAAQVTRYVKPSSTGTGNGSSWSNASNDIQAMITASSSGDRIWVAAGTYVPSTLAGNGSTNRDKAFVLKEGVKLYGGFAGSETALTDRDWNQNVTVLSGDLGTAGNASDNAYHVVIACGTSSSPITTATVLDGFTITGGNGNGSSSITVNSAFLYRAIGGGMVNYYASPTLTNLIVTNHSVLSNGGGIANLNYSSPIITNSTISSNSADYQGGGLYNEIYSSPIFTSVIINNNTSKYEGGGAYSLNKCSLDFTNCTISGNKGSAGGGLYNAQNSLANFKNSSIYSNSASGSGGGIYNHTSRASSCVNVSIKGNSASSGAGGYNYNSEVSTYVNVIVSGNLGGITGGIYNNTSPVVLINVTMAGNFTYALYNYNSSATIKNSIIFGNNEGVYGQTNSYYNSLVQGVSGGSNGNLDGDTHPKFVNPVNPGLATTGGDYRLTPCSPAINTGSNEYVPSDVDKDVAGERRIYASTVDMGACEEQGIDKATYTIRYVKPAASGKGNGTSWENAAEDLQNMINTSCDQVWVAAGTYKPTTLPTYGNYEDRNKTFRLRSNIKVYGGFSGSETALSQRNWTSNSTILSGVLWSNPGGTSKTYHVVVAVGSSLEPITQETILDGFTISDGDAKGTDYILEKGYKLYQNSGGGIVIVKASPTLRNLIITNNTVTGSGGGIFGENSGSLLLENVYLKGNSSSKFGGAIANYNASNPSVTSCTIAGNSAMYGGAMFNSNSSPVLLNVLITGNTASSQGGGCYNLTGSSPVFTNVTLSGNTYYALYNEDNWSKPVVKNSIIYGNTSGSYGIGTTYFNSLVQGVNGGTDGNLDGSVNPLFVTPVTPKLSTAGNYRLQPCSPAIGAGDNVAVPEGVLKDLAGETRIYGDRIDMGAYEYQEAIETGARRLALEGSTMTVSVANDKSYSLLVPDDVCRAMAVVRSSGSTPVAGNVAVTVWVDPEVASYKGSPYVQRHYDLSPAVSGATATARITLYFTQDEFNAFNATTVSDLLPVSSDDESGKSHLRMYQYHGAPSEGNTPAHYSGASVVLDPADEDIVWNPTLKRWEISFDVTGFSGFFAGSVSSPLPVHVVAFEGRYLDGKKVGLEWKVVQQEKITSYTVEYSSDARNFSYVGQVQATNTTEATYNFDDIQERSGSLAYYRLRILETGGSEALSRIISVKLPYNETISVYPVPSFQTVWVKGKGIAGSELKLLDQQGRLVKNVEVKTNEQSLDLSGLPAGVYFIQVLNQGTFKIIKE